MFGGSRPKKTRFRTTAPLANKLSGPCTGEHPPRWTRADGATRLHKPWGVTQEGKFATAEEAEYPRDLCEARLDAIGFAKIAAPANPVSASHKAASSSTTPLPARADVNYATPATRRENWNVWVPPTTQQPSHRKQDIGKQLRAPGVGRQACGRGHPELVAEYKTVLDFNIESKSAKLALRAWASARSCRLERPLTLDGTLLLTASRLLAIAGHTIRGRYGADEAQRAVFETIGSTAEGVRVQVQAGTPWSEEEFFEEAKRVEHPFKAGFPLRPGTAKAVYYLLEKGPQKTTQRRRRGLARWRSRRDELAASCADAPAGGVRRPGQEHLALQGDARVGWLPRRRGAQDAGGRLPHRR